VQVALLAAIWSGALLFGGVDWTLGIRTLIVHYLWETLIDQFNFSILVFTLSLVGMVQIANRAGGGQGLADAVGRMARNARSSKIAASILGLLIFFDDYSNTVVVGTTIRSLTDRYKVSREKLAYIVDSTSAPVAGIALISTWIGYEVGLFQELSNSLDLGIAGYAIFLKVLPLRFYCFGALALVLLTSYMERDYGPMLGAERRAAKSGELTAPGSKPLVSRLMTGIKTVEGVRPWWPTVGVPVLTALVATVAGMIVEGRPRRRGPLSTRS
ncbi:MAG: Na+/H+ antiporter NhaC family protein, partial [Deltaproteobacteria bacterium]|nr:Na+/H+ antiporter NhaC family protein [Deltaproteobacteria bacterium]